MTEAEGRAALLKTAELWLHTPYCMSDACIRGVGANCATLMYGIARDAGVLPSDMPEPRWYSPQLHAHSREERLIKSVLGCGCVEISESQVKPGDVIAYLTGLSHGHLAMVIEYPRKVIQTHKATGCEYGHALEGRLAGCKRLYFSLWKPPETGEK
jgi:cell wall-associated NlpC family hydrolase